MLDFEKMLNDALEINCRKYKTVTIKIDDEPVIANIISRGEFIRTFHQLETLMLDDNKEYYVLYEEVGTYEVFWCISTSDVTFKHAMFGWYYDELSDEEYQRKLRVYDNLRQKLKEYAWDGDKIDESAYRFYKNMQQWTNTPTDPDVQADNKACLITYLEQSWNAWLQSILDREYKYMNVTQIVWDSWAER